MACGKQHVRLLARIGHPDHGYRYPDILRYFLPKNRPGRCRTRHYHDGRNAFFPGDDAGSMGAGFGKWRTWISAAERGRQTGDKDTAIIAGAIVVLSDCAQRILKQKK